MREILQNMLPKLSDGSVMYHAMLSALTIPLVRT
jgi:hypothetical protein